MRCSTLLALLAGVMLYLVMGALVFRSLEAPEEQRVHDELLRTKDVFLSSHHCVNMQDFNKLLERVVSAVEAGLDAGSSSPNLTSRWDLSSAFFFCGTIITTIGFGNLSPHTWFGQLFCVCFALVGIPMFGILLAGVGDHMGTMLRRAVAKIETLFLKSRVSPTSVRVISAVLSILIGCLMFLAVPTVVFQEMEDWTFLEALYFVVITLTTVGFGDYVPGGRRPDAFFKPLVWLWIVFGLAYFASILTMIAKWLKVLSKRTRAEMEELRAHATDWTQNIQNMSMDFRIPNPLEFNDPFLLQRRRWKRSERRRVRRGAQVTLGYRTRKSSMNGHLANHWAGLSRSMSRLEARSPGKRVAAAVSAARLRVKGSGIVQAAGSVEPRVDPGVAMRSDCKTFARTYGRSLSLPATTSVSELDGPDPAMMEGSPFGSDSPFDSTSNSSSSSSSSSLGLHSYTFGQTLDILEQGFQSSTEPRGARDTAARAKTQTQDLPLHVVEAGRTPSPLPLSHSTPLHSLPKPWPPHSLRTPGPPHSPRRPGPRHSLPAPWPPYSPRKPCHPHSPRTPGPPNSPRTPGPPNSPRTPSPPHSPRTPSPPHSPCRPSPPHSPCRPSPPHSPRTPSPPHLPCTPSPPHSPCTPSPPHSLQDPAALPTSPSPADCQLLDFFGENFAYIDESSDTLSDRCPPTESEASEERRQPRKPKRKSMRRQLPNRNSVQARRRRSRDILPPSNPPTPPPQIN